MSKTKRGTWHLSCWGALLITILLFTGCTTGVIQPKKIVGDQKTREIINVLREKEPRIENLKGLFRASITGSILPLSRTLPGVVFYNRPDSIRLKGLTPVGGTFFQFTRSSNNYRLMLPASGRLTSGSIHELHQAGDIGKVVDLSLRAMDAVLGKVKGLESDEVRFYEEDRGFRTDFLESRDRADEVALTRTWVDKQRHDIVYVEYLNHDGELLMSIECEDFRSISPQDSAFGLTQYLPFRVQAEDTRLSGSVTLLFQELVLNAGS
ncbi:MAG: hypothetical protein ACPGYT_03765 [Nitrospirales bacterium]